MSIEQNDFLQRQSANTGSLRPIITRYERQALGILHKVSARFGMAVVPKLQISEALPLYTSEKAKELCDFAMRESFDFTITFDSSPVLAIEFDGPDYLKSNCAENDRLKRTICDRFNLPILRVDTQYLRTIATFTTLELVIEEVLNKFTSDEWRSSSDFYHHQMNTTEGADLELPHLDLIRSSTHTRFIGRRAGITTASMLITKIAALELITNTGQLFLTKRLSKSVDGFFTAVALAVLDEDTAILGVGSVFQNPKVPIEAMELADALSVIDVLDQIRLFDESRYAGLEMRHALEFLAHFKEYTADEAGSRFLSLNPLCKPLTGQWLRSG